MNRLGLEALIIAAAEMMLAQSPAAVVRFRLLRDVLDEPGGDPARAEAQAELAGSRWVRQLASEQWADGGWGAFHTQDTRRKQAIPTTEVGVERALALGLEISHPVLTKVKNYLVDLLQGKIAFPDRPEKNDRWATGARLFTAATLARIQPGHIDLEHDRRLWLRIAELTFQSGFTNENDEAQAHAELTGASVRDSYLVLRGKYQLSLIGSGKGGFPPSLETALLTWLWNLPDGIGYLSTPLEPPHRDQPNFIDRWLASHELLGQYFPGWRHHAGSVVDWLLAAQQPDGYWDFGPRPARQTYLPLSDSWRERKNRKTDWTVRVLTVLKRYTDTIRVTNKR